jgi:hypothetical protein
MPLLGVQERQSARPSELRGPELLGSSGVEENLTQQPHGHAPSFGGAEEHADSVQNSSLGAASIPQGSKKVGKLPDANRSLGSLNANEIAWHNRK